MSFGESGAEEGVAVERCGSVNAGGVACGGCRVEKEEFWVSGKYSFIVRWAVGGRVELALFRVRRGRRVE